MRDRVTSNGRHRLIHKYVCVCFILFCLVFWVFFCFVDYFMGRRSRKREERERKRAREREKERDGNIKKKKREYKKLVLTEELTERFEREREIEREVGVEGRNGENLISKAILWDRGFHST